MLISLHNRITEETYPLSLISGPSYLVVQFRITFCGSFWDMFPLRIICDRKSWPKVISNYLQVVTRKYKWYSLILAKVHTSNFIKNTLHHGWSSCNFPSFSEFLENFGAGSEYRTFRFFPFIATYTFIFIFLKMHRVRTLEIWAKTNFLCQTKDKSSWMKPMACLLLLSCICTFVKNTFS